MSIVKAKLQIMSNEELLQLSNELRQPVVADDALIRDLIKGSEMDTTTPMIAFVGVGQLLCFELADRLLNEMNRFQFFKIHGVDLKDVSENGNKH